MLRHLQKSLDRAHPKIRLEVLFVLRVDRLDLPFSAILEGTTPSATTFRRPYGIATHLAEQRFDKEPREAIESAL